MKRIPRWTLPLAVLALGFASPSAGSPLADPAFGAYWHDGKAELDGYRMTISRYDAPRQGHAVLIYVTEPFSRSKHVKVDDPAKAPADVVDVLKLNLVRDFQTGIYDYNTMVSLFSASETFAPIKVSFSSTEWCGNIYQELNFFPTRVEDRVDSYFEGESATRTLALPAGGVIEDNLFILLRGLRGDYLQPGEKRTVPFLSSPFHSRLAHRPLAWISATIERSRGTSQVRVPAGVFATSLYTVRVSDGREGTFSVERAYPHRIVRWAWSPGTGAPGKTFLGGSHQGELSGTSRVQYWKLHNPGDETALRPLGLAPLAP
ncbi:MAG: hypothetical protein ABI960_02285 [Candidatus Eisenbacteria bacterium]